MRKLKKLGALMLAGALMVSAVACGGTGETNTGDKGAMSVADRIADSQKKMSEIKSASMDMNMIMNMSVKVEGQDAQEMNITTSGKIDMFNDPLKAKMEMSMDMGEMGGKQDIQMYMEQVDGKIISYTGVAGQWGSMEVDASDIEQYSVKESSELYLNSMSDMKEVGTEQIDGKDAIKIEGVVKGEELKKIIDASGVADNLKSTGVDQATFDKILSSMGDFKMAIWLDADNYMVKVEEDLTDMMTKVMEKMLEGTEQAGQITFTKVEMTATYKNMDQVEDFEIPEEAKNATPIQQ